MALDSFNVYHSYLKALEPLNDAECGRLLKACIQYSMTGEVPELRGNERFLFPTWQSQIDRDKEKYEAKCRRNSENVSKRWNTTVYEKYESIPDDTKYTKDKDKNKDKDKDKDKEGLTVSNETVCRTDVQRIIDAWNSLGLAHVSKIIPGKDRDKWLKARVREYGVDSVLLAIENVRNSDFLMGRSGGGSRPFQATFDWFIRPNNFPKVLDGNYNNKSSASVGKFSWAELAAQMEAEGKL